MSENPAAQEPAPAPSGAPVVSLRDVTRTFGQVVALDNVTLDIPPGAVGLLGPNGAGKSTMLKVILGLIKPTSGSLSVLGIDPVRDPIEARRRVGYMPEVDAYVTGLTGVESVAFAGVLSGLPRSGAMQRAHTVLNYVGLDEVRYRKVEEYSTGMRQRVRLAQALVHDPGVLFLDEPTNGLDPDGREEILKVIRELSRQHGKHVVLCSHLLRDVEASCERVVLLGHGRLVREGSIREVTQGRRDAFQLTHRGDPERFEAALRAAGCEIERGEGVLRASVPAGTGTGVLFRIAAETGTDLRSVIPDSVSLEEAFVAAVDGPGGGR